MSRAAPPGEERAAGRGGTRRHRRSKRSDNAEPEVTDKKPFCKRRFVRVCHALSPDEWLVLKWWVRSSRVERFTQAVAPRVGGAA